MEKERVTLYGLSKEAIETWPALAPFSGALIKQPTGNPPSEKDLEGIEQVLELATLLDGQYKQVSELMQVDSSLWMLEFVEGGIGFDQAAIIIELCYWLDFTGREEGLTQTEDMFIRPNGIKK